MPLPEPIAKLLKAVADEAPREEVLTAARGALRDLSRRRARLQRDSELLQELVIRYGGIEVSELAADAEDARLTDAQKAAINGLLDETLAVQPDIAVADMIERVRTLRGIDLAELVEKPQAVMGSMIFQAKKRIKPAVVPQPTATQQALPAQPTAAPAA